MASPPESPRVLGVCAGVGGLELGIKRVFPGSRLVGLCERDAYAASVLLARMESEALEPAPVYTGDLHDFPAAEFAGRVDILCGGIPCQPHSVAGRGERDADERDLVDRFLDIARVVGPSLVIVENVAAFVHPRGLGRLLGGLADLGFDAEWTTLRASDIGAPHRRERCFVLAHGGRERREGQQRPGAAARATRRGDGAEVADADGGRREGRSDHWPLDWPPGPNSPEWASVLAHDPTLAPALPPVRGVADGLPDGLDPTAYRRDRLRCLGNAVVPAQAEQALQLLLERAGLTRDPE